MADSFGKKDREKKKRQRKEAKLQRKKARQEEGNSTEEFVFVDHLGNLTTTRPDPTVKREVDPETISVSVPTNAGGDENPFLHHGRVKFFNEDKGYGFIVDSATQQDYFVHADNLHMPIRDNDLVSFEVGKGARGPMAIEVRLAD